MAKVSFQIDATRWDALQKSLAQLPQTLRNELHAKIGVQAPSLTFSGSGFGETQPVLADGRVDSGRAYQDLLAAIGAPQPLWDETVSPADQLKLTLKALYAAVDALASEKVDLTDIISNGFDDASLPALALQAGALQALAEEFKAVVARTVRPGVYLNDSLTSLAEGAASFAKGVLGASSAKDVRLPDPSTALMFKSRINGALRELEDGAAKGTLPLMGSTVAVVGGLEQAFQSVDALVRDVSVTDGRRYGEKVLAAIEVLLPLAEATPELSAASQGLRQIRALLKENLATRPDQSFTIVRNRWAKDTAEGMALVARGLEKGIAEIFKAVVG